MRNHLLHLLALLLLALLIYTPWASVPFPLVDYSEFLHLLRAGESFGDGLRRVVEYYQSHGRSSYLAYLQLALNWQLFGDRAAAWNLAVFIYSMAAVTAAWALLVRIGIKPLAATLAAALLIVATPAVPVWLRPTGEPLALLFLALSLIAALSYQQAARWVGRLVVMLVLMLGIALAKDLLAPLMILPVILACCWHDGFEAPRLNRRTVWLIAGAMMVAACSAFMIGNALLQRMPDAYTESYRLGNISPPQFAGLFWQILLPLTHGFETTVVVPAYIAANVAFGMLIVSGWFVALRTRRAHMRELNAWLLLVFLGALLYLPLSWFSPLYAFPFFLGSVALLARALSAFEAAPAAARRFAHAGAITVLTICGVIAFDVARREFADRRMHGRLSTALRGIENADGIVVGSVVINRWEWAQQAVIIRRYAIDRGDLPENAPPARDITCGSLSPAELNRVIVINYPEACGDLGFEALEITEPYLSLAPKPERRFLRVQLAAFGTNAAAP